jgi:hypothetical protein
LQEITGRFDMLKTFNRNNEKRRDRRAGSGFPDFESDHFRGFASVTRG